MQKYFSYKNVRIIMGILLIAGCIGIHTVWSQVVTTNREESLTFYIPNAVGYYYDFLIHSEGSISTPVFYDNSKGFNIADKDTAYQFAPDKNEHGSRLNVVCVAKSFKTRTLYYNNPYRISPAGTTVIRDLVCMGASSGNSACIRMGARSAENELPGDMGQHRPNFPKWVWPEEKNPPPADVAEYIAGSQYIHKGDVVIFEKACMIAQSKKAYDPRIAGIVSENPFFIMGESKGKYPLALCGRVPCNVVDENGPIKPGDILVTSSTAGHAMKADLSQIKAGCIVGKALEGFQGKGKGKIYVLVNAR